MKTGEYRRLGWFVYDKIKKEMFWYQYYPKQTVIFDVVEAVALDQIVVLKKYGPNHVIFTK